MARRRQIRADWAWGRGEERGVAAAARARLWWSAREGLTHRQWGTADEEVLPRVFAQLGLYVLHECRGPMRLWDFSRRLALRLGMRHTMPPVELCDAVRATLESTNHPRLRLLAPGCVGHGCRLRVRRGRPGLLARPHLTAPRLPWCLSEIPRSQPHHRIVVAGIGTPGMGTVAALGAAGEAGGPAWWSRWCEPADRCRRLPCVWGCVLERRRSKGKRADMAQPPQTLQKQKRPAGPGVFALHFRRCPLVSQTPIKLGR